jgi:hypothetical protein
MTMWRVVEKASKPPKGLAGRFKRSLSLNASKGVDGELDRLNGELHAALGGLSTQLLQLHSALTCSSPQSGQSFATINSMWSEASSGPSLQLPLQGTTLQVIARPSPALCVLQCSAFATLSCLHFCCMLS